MERTLGEFITLQKAMMEALGIPPEPHPFSHAAVTEAVNGLVEESVEVLKAKNEWTKPWKGTTQASSYLETMHESIDVFFMLLELWILLGLEPEVIFQQYQEKFFKNLKRIKESSVSSI